MLLVSQIIDKAREIKSKIGIKSYDDKVLGFYNKLVEGLDSYPETDNISVRISKEKQNWLSTLYNEEPTEKETSAIRKKFSVPETWNETYCRSQMHDLCIWDEEELRTTQYPKWGIEFESICFTKALLFYLCALDYHIDNPNIEGKKTDAKKSIKVMPINLDFIKLYFEEKATIYYQGLLEAYNHTIKKVDKDYYTKCEVEEYSRLLNFKDTGNNWAYLTDNLPHGFHSIEILREKLNWFHKGYFYEAVFHFDGGKKIISELLSIEKYIAFLKNQSVITEKVAKPAKPYTSTLYSFMLNYNFQKKTSPAQKQERIKLVNEKFLRTLISLRENGFISVDSSEKLLKGIIDADPVNKKVVWVGTKGSLHYFVKRISKKLNQEYSQWESAVNCFVDKDGKEIDLVSLRSNMKKKGLQFR